MNDTHFDHKLTIEQLLKLLARAKAGKRGDRDYLMVLIGVSHGLRNVEICNLEVKDFDMDEGTVTVRRGKSSLKTTQPLGRSDNPLLDEYSAVTAYLVGKRGKLFDIKPGMFRLLFKKYAKEVGIPKRLAHPHVVKHSAAHYALKASNNDLVAVQRFLGHKNLSSTGMYLKMGDAEACAKVQKNYFKG